MVVDGPCVVVAMHGSVAVLTSEWRKLPCFDCWHSGIKDNAVTGCEATGTLRLVVVDYLPCGGAVAGTRLTHTLTLLCTHALRIHRAC